MASHAEQTALIGACVRQPDMLWLFLCDLLAVCCFRCSYACTFHRQAMGRTFITTLGSLAGALLLMFAASCSPA